MKDSRPREARPNNLVYIYIYIHTHTRTPERDHAEQERKAGEDKRCRAAEALAAAVMQAAQAEEMRELAERGRADSDSVRTEQLAQVLSAVATMRMEHDGMLEGALLLHRRVRARGAEGQA